MRGFLNGTSDFCAGAAFRVDGRFLGRVRAAYDLTPEMELAPGLHVLETEADEGSAGCHTVWGFDGPRWLDRRPEHYVAIGAICKDENSYVGDWVRHHVAAGVSHVYLLDNGSKIPLAHTVAEEGLSAIVTVETFPWLGQGTQNEAYRHILRKWGPECFWIALIDIDEFIIPKVSPCLRRTMSAFEDFGALRVPWMMLGSNGLKERPGDQLAAFTDSYIDPHVKSIVRPLFVKNIPNPHWIEMMEGRPEAGEHFDGDCSTQHIQINHYWTRSESEWRDKIARGTVAPGYERSWEDFPAHQARCVSEDHSAERWRLAAAREAPRRDHHEITGFIHVAAVNHWEGLLGQQLSKIRKSGLWEKTAVIYLGITGAKSGLENTAEILRDLPSKVKIAYLDPRLDRYEFPTLERLQGHCRSVGGFVWYIHTKGVVHQYHWQKGWRGKMEEFVIIHHDLAIGRLERGYAAAAAFGSTDERWPVPGNFWWAQSGHIRSLPDVRFLNQGDRHEAERWIAMNGTREVYFHDYGDTRFAGWEITSARTGAGRVTTGGYHGWERIPVLPPKNSRCDVMISAHAPSCTVVRNTVPLKVFGFTSGSAESRDWKVEFVAGGRTLGGTDHPSWRSEETILPPGTHRLTVSLASGEHWGAHTAWGVTACAPERRDEAATETPPAAPADQDKTPLFPLETRTGILRSLAHLRGYRSYLEIGLGDGANFRAVECPEKVSVDPEGTPVHRMTSDEFFGQNVRKFDLIFIDGLHEEETVTRDLENALRALNPGGAVVCHDLNPASEIMQRVPRITDEWTGDCWKAWVKLRARLPGCLMTVFDADYGVGVLIPGAKCPNPLSGEPAEPLDWRNFTVRGGRWLNLLPAEAAWREMLEDGWPE